MTRELIINGQHVDVMPNTNITLSYTNDITGDIGKISLSRSYTIKLPRTSRNAKIFDNPESPGYGSGTVRRFLPARYYRNGIDLIGDARAYLLSASAQQYEVALVWSGLDALQALSQSGETLNDLPNLPKVTWIDTYATSPDYSTEYSGGVLFAQYVTGLPSGLNPRTSNAAPHPSMRLANILERIMTYAGVPYSLSSQAQERFTDVVLLVAPNHAPDLEQEKASGAYSYGYQGSVGSSYGYEKPIKWTTVYKGWDSPTINAENSQFTGISANDPEVEHSSLVIGMALQFKNSETWRRCSIRIYETLTTEAGTTRTLVLERNFVRSGNTLSIQFSDELSINSAATYEIMTYDMPDNVSFEGITGENYGFWLYPPHKVINLSQTNKFPIAGNLPNIKQWDFVKGCLAAFGLIGYVKQGVYHIVTVSEYLSTDSAIDWSAKLAEIDPDTVKHSLSGWAQINAIKYKADVDLNFDPNAYIYVEDETAKAQADRYTLPFAASRDNIAIHYEAETATKVKDVKIEPRIFKVRKWNGLFELDFAPTLYGGLFSQLYEGLQDAVRTPVIIQVQMRLSEMDLAHIDFSTTIYLAQFGRFYAILSIQNSDSDICKVELLQLP